MALDIAQVRKGRPASDSIVSLGFLLPGALFLLLFVVIPFAMAVFYSFTNLRLISPLPMEFVGLRNYVRALSDAIFQRAIWNNMLFVVIVVPVQTCLALWMALLVNQKLQGVNILRTIYFAPVVTVMAVAAVVWKLLLQPDGLFNTIISLFRKAPIDIHWLHEPSTALAAIIIMSIWQGVGFQMIIILAGLQDIPEQLYEAASIDGANWWHQFAHVTIPQLRNTLVFVVTVTIILAFKLFDQVYVLTQGGPLDRTQTMMYQVVTVGFSQQRIGLASAMAVIFFLIVLSISLIQRYFVREEGEV